MSGKIDGTSISDLTTCIDTLRRACGFKITVTRHGSANTWNTTIEWQGETYSSAGFTDEDLLAGIFTRVAEIVQRHKDRVLESLDELAKRAKTEPSEPAEPTIIHIGDDHNA